MKNGKKARGSLSLEAVISATVFISVMFLLLTMVKMVLVMTVLNNAAVETAKVVATSGYPIALLNELQSEKLEEQAEKLSPTSLENSLKTGVSNTFVTGLFTGKMGAAAGSNAADMLKNLIGGAVAELSKEYIYQAKADLANSICSSVIKDYVEDCGLQIDQSKLMLRAIKIPETDGEFKVQHTEAMQLSESGSLAARPGEHFGADDVLISLEYPYEMALPFLPAFEVTLRSTAVERAWIHSTGVAPSRNEGIQLDNWLSKTVYIGSRGYSKCYHRANCITLSKGSTPLSLTSAKNQGYSPCGVCHPPTS